MTSRYVLRKNNYKTDLYTKLLDEIKKCMDQVGQTNDTITRIRKVRRIYIILNTNFDLFTTSIYHKLIDAAYKRIDIFKNDIAGYIEKNPTKTHKTCTGTLMQFNKYKKIYNKYWTTIALCLNKKTCGDMTREIMQYIH
jgi:hypothetical protein